MTTASLDKFKGCLVGAVIGDCLGAPVECQWWGGIPAERVEKRFEDYFNHGSNSRLFKYTDDTAMARLVPQDKAIKIVKDSTFRFWQGCIKSLYLAQNT